MAKKNTKVSRSSTERNRSAGAAANRNTKKKTTKTAKKTTKKAAAAASGTTQKRTKKSTKKKTTGKPKSPLTRRELAQYRKLLVEKASEILGDMMSMSKEALHADSANLSHMPIHMADVGSDNYEQELMLGLVESERRLVLEINEALHRIQEGTYGVCEESGKPIGKARLNAKPWAKHCIEVARELERNGRLA